MSFENPPRPKKVESHQPLVFTDPEPKILKPSEAESPASETEPVEKPAVFGSMADFNAHMREHGEYDYESAFKKDAAEVLEKFGSSTTPESRAEYKAKLKGMLEEYTEILESKTQKTASVAEQPQPEEAASSAKTPVKKWIKGLYFEDKEPEAQIKPETAAPSSTKGNPKTLNLTSAFGEVKAEANQKKIGEPKTREELRIAQETRAKNFAEKLGISDKREAMLQAEKELFEHKVNSAKKYSVIENPEIREKYIQAQLEWSKALKEAAASGDKRTQLEAMIIDKRDTIIRPNTVSVEARKEVLNTLGKTTLGKALTWAALPPKLVFKGGVAVFKGYGWGLSKMAEGGVAGHEFFAKTFLNKKLSAGEKENLLKNYKRASGVLTGALIGTIATAGAGGAAAAGWRVVRSGFSSLLGAGIAIKAGNFYKKNYGDVAADELYKQVRTSADTKTELLARQVAHRKGNRETRTKNQQYVEIGAAILAGAGTNVALAEASQLFSNLSSVQHAAGVVSGHEHAPGSHHESVVKAPVKPAVSHERFEHQPHASAGHELPPTKPEAAVPAAGSETLAVDAKLDDANKLIGHFAEKLQHDYQGVHPEHVPPAVKTYQGLFETKPGARLELGENHAAHELGLRAHGLSEIMHKGDTIVLNKDNQIVINWAEHGRPPAVLIESDGSVHEFNDMLSGPSRMSADHLSHHAAPHTPLHTAPGQTSHEAPAAQPATTHTPESHTVAQRLVESSAKAQSAPATPDTSVDGLSQSQKEAYALEIKNNGILTHTESTPVASPNPPNMLNFDQHPLEAQPVSSVPEHTPEIPSSTPEHPNMLNFDQHPVEMPPSVNALTNTPGWSSVRNIRSLDIFTIPANPDEPTALLMQERFLAVVKESGLAPVENQSVDQYIQLATKAIADKASH